MQKFDWCKTLYIVVDKVDGFLRKYNRTKYLVLFSIFDRIRYLIESKNDIAYAFSHKLCKNQNRLS